MYIHAFILTYAYVCICIYFCIYLHAYLSKNEFILISPLWSSTARFILAFPLSSSSLLSLTVRNLAPIVCKLNTYLINPIMHVVSEWLIHIPMKNKILTRMLSLYFFFFWSLALWTPINASFPKVIEVSSFFSLLDPILIFSKCFHIWLYLWLHHYCCIREEEAMTCGICIGFSGHVISRIHD